MISLHQIQIAKPCTADWNAMTGNVQTRFCAYCKKEVQDLSQMTTAQAQALLDRTNLKVCVRIAHMADGRILTRDTVFTPKKMGHKARGSVNKVKPRTKSQTLTGDIVVLGGKPVVPPPSPPPTQTMGTPLLAPTQ